ncbi:MAG: hypothetical protein Q4F30_00375 [Akkermansia sp.]|nr:hypothetical protein [Akkermansia sp.]
MRKGSLTDRLKALKGSSRKGTAQREAWRDTAYRSGDFQLRNEQNTLPPLEEVLEARKRHHTRVMTGTARRDTRNNLVESLILLAIMVASIYGIYRLIISLLSEG